MMKSIKMKRLLSLMSILFMFSFFTLGVNAEVHYLAEGGSDYMGINIDGNYTDWVDKPMTKVQYEWDTGNNYHLGSLFRDENYLYFYFQMSDRSYTGFNGYNSAFIVDGVEHKIELIVEGNRITVRNQNGWTLVENASGYITQQSGVGDRVEVKIPLIRFSSNPENIRTIEFHNSNLGPQHIIATGTDTGAILIASTGFVFAAGTLLIRRKQLKTQTRKRVR